MKFFCEYCGNRIDANVDDKCPGCGASYKKNKTFIELEKEKKEEKRLFKEYSHRIFNNSLNAMKFSRWFLLIPIIVFIIIIIIAISVTSNSFKEENRLNNVEEFFDNLDNNQDTQQDIVVKLDEFAETKDYKVKVTKYEVEKDIFNSLEDGYEYVKFYLLVENLTNDRLTKEDVNCIVDGIAQTNEFSSEYSDLPMFINKGLTVKGTATFEVPKDATSYDIKYGDYVTIHIEK